MQKVNGIGGVFLKADNPELLGKWYKKHFGIPMPPETYDQPEWHQAAGPTVFAFMGNKSEHFGTKKDWGINFRVDNLEIMITQLEADGVSVERDPEKYPNGIFAYLKDPEGNSIQLWQPIR